MAKKEFTVAQDEMGALPDRPDDRAVYHQLRGESLDDRSYLAYVRATPRPFRRFVSGHFPAGTTTQPHSHALIALHGCLQGPLALVTPGGEELVDAGVFWLIPPGVRHSWRNPGRQTAATISVLVDAEHPGRWPAGSGVRECCDKLLQSVRKLERFDVTGDDEMRRLYWLAADQLTALEARDTSITFGILLALVGLCATRLTVAPETARSPDDLAQQIRRVLLARVNERLSIRDVARQLHVSPTRAKEAFRKSFGCGIVSYHNQLKIWQAKRLLCDLSLTVEHVSNKLGFSTPSYFSQVFSQHTGETPTDFRRRDGG